MITDADNSKLLVGMHTSNMARH